MNDGHGLVGLPLRRGWRSLLTLVGIVALLAAATLALAACGDDEEEAVDGEDGEVGGLLQEAIDQGYIEIGIANEAPYGFEDEEGNVTGEAPEVAKEIFSRLGVPEVRAVVTEFGALIAGLSAGRFDVIAAGMFITPDRAEQVNFTDPDYCALQSFAVEAGNPHNIQTFEDIAANEDVTLGVLQGAVEQGYAEEAGVPSGRMQVFPDPPDLYEALSAGRIDAVALTSITNAWQVTNNFPDLETTTPFAPIVEGEEQFGCGAFGFRFDNDATRDAFNDVLHEMQANDELLPIVQPFGFGQEELDRAEGTTVEDFAQ